jgi:hypothetical protein
MNGTFSHYDPGQRLQFLGPLCNWLSPDYSFSPLLDLASFHSGVHRRLTQRRHSVGRRETRAKVAVYYRLFRPCPSCQPMAVHQGGEMTLKRAADLVRATGVRRFVISSDAGQSHNPWPDDMLRAFINCLYDVEITEDEIHQMVVTNPATLLGLL